MTYETALDWALEHIPPTDFADFADWYNQVDKKMNTPNLMSNPIFNRMLEVAWENITGTPTIEPTFARPPSRTKEVRSPVQPRIYYAPAKELEKQQEVIALPPTGRAPEIPRPILIMPEEQKLTETQKIKNFFGRLNPFRKRK